jgi:hypothetical protein
LATPNNFIEEMDSLYHVYFSIFEQINFHQNLRKHHENLSHISFVNLSFIPQVTPNIEAVRMSEVEVVPNVLPQYSEFLSDNTALKMLNSSQDPSLYGAKTALVLRDLYINFGFTATKFKN